MAVPSTRQELIDYCLRRLGAPVIEINVDEDQIEDRVDEAIQMYREYHTDAVYQVYLKHQLTQEDIDNRYIVLPDNIINVRGVVPSSSTGTGSGMFSIEYQMFFTDALDLRNMGGLSNYVQTKQYLQMINMTLGDVRSFEYNRHVNYLSPRGDWFDKLSAGQYVIMDIDAWLDPDGISPPLDASGIYNDLWLKKYTTALIKRQWGMNLIKFDGMLLPGGVQLNGRQLFDDANAEIDELEQQIRETYELPVDFITG